MVYCRTGLSRSMYKYKLLTFCPPNSISSKTKQTQTWCNFSICNLYGKIRQDLQILCPLPQFGTSCVKIREWHRIRKYFRKFTTKLCAVEVYFRFYYLKRLDLVGGQNVNIGNVHCTEKLCMMYAMYIKNWTVLTVNVENCTKFIKFQLQTHTYQIR